MNTAISNSVMDIKNRTFSVHFSQPDADDRREVEHFISEIFYQAYGAKIRRFKPCLMSLRDQDNKLVAACGFRSAALETLFLETYLDHPIEEVLSERVGFPVRRNEIVGVGNFSVAEPGMARYLIAAINDHLHETSNQWAVFTAVPILRNVFAKLEMEPIILGDADKNRLPLEEQVEWGSYYVQKPQVMAVKRLERYSEPQIIKNRVHEALTSDAPSAGYSSGIRCKTCGMTVRKNDALHH